MIQFPRIAARSKLARTVLLSVAAFTMVSAGGRTTKADPKPPSTAAPSYDGRPMIELAPATYVDPEATITERQALVEGIRSVRTEISTLLGPLRSQMPLVLFCKTKPCDLYFTGPSRRSVSLGHSGLSASGARYVTTGPTVIVLRVDAKARAFLEHELLHIEVRTRLHGMDVPAWFDDGVAAFLSNTPDCPRSPIQGVDDLRRLDNEGVWGRYTDFRGAAQPTYCQVKAELGAWVQRHGQQALIALIDQVGKGTPFNTAYGSLQTVTAPRTTPIMTPATEIGDQSRPFSIAMWIKPRADDGVLTLLSETPIGTGWCSPLLGFDDSHRLVAQLLAAGGPALSNFTLATAPQQLPLGVWSHVAMTWKPRGAQRLYVDGHVVAEVPAGRYYADGPSMLMYLTWGSYNMTGPDQSWRGAVTRASFDGGMTGMQVYDVELSPSQIAELARARP